MADMKCSHTGRSAGGQSIGSMSNPLAVVDTLHSKSRATPTAKQAPRRKGRGRRRKTDDDREIETVVFGNVRFRAWYQSWYPKDFIGEGKGVIKNLYVCPKCFAYSRGEDDTEIHAWLRHWRSCRRVVIPGNRIYVHGNWEEKGIDGVEEEKGTWSIWEVDGATETLFCQNLSLFAKIFLDNKSVFFDVSTFNFFLLVYAPPSADPPQSPQIVGFFSKEKMSWDNNNLACILIFPPWQHRGLGSLLIGISYAIARREEIMGGPEKPISELGMKSYQGYWASEIAKFLLQWREDTHPGLDVNTISRGTWISPDDCLSVLREMEIYEHGGSLTLASHSLQMADEQSEALETQGKLRRRGTNKKKDCVHIDKQRVRKWVACKGIRMERLVCEQGFRPGYALKIRQTLE
ncbi:BgTH12-06103 [Blumeria graminis f. sp. triticale]|uniref:BgTH12-06103 n=1 Tax=Blumeria graminis f. sp. triticale TaxID=1689686 RepID=A0A9W4D5S4_BLUGR|nr:BgTH12-06103 [Blumeria graminis f. sp. triticale]